MKARRGLAHAFTTLKTGCPALLALFARGRAFRGFSMTASLVDFVFQVAQEVFVRQRGSSAANYLGYRLPQETSKGWGTLPICERGENG